MIRHLYAIAALLCLFFAQPAARAQNPFAPPQATAHYEPDRQYDLQHVKLEITLDWPNRRFAGRVTHTVEMLRIGTEIVFDAGADLKIKTCAVNGRPAQFDHANGRLRVFPARPVPARGSRATVVIAYELAPAPQGKPALNGMYGFHWVVPDKFEPARKPAFWTQGETIGNREWVPIYDYPNDKTTSETIVEAPESWFVVGNGRLLSNTVNARRHTRTLHWSMTQPHATYLLSLAGGEMDIAKSNWQGVDLYYCVPRGEGSTIPASFSDTPDMLSFFSSVLGVKYAWPKYAQTAMFDFGGGMENVSATTLGEGSLADARSGIHPMASLNSHELSHQWFGDLITCKDWSHIWLNEGFATFFEQLYIEHSRGKDYYDREREGALQAYLGESRRYKRPIVTRYYPSPDSMFDSHTYPKGGLVLHMLRRLMGDADFFKGLRYYLTIHGYKPVDTDDLVRSLQDSTGRSLEAFFDQWVYKPGHPVIDYSWRYDEASKEIVIDVSQLQDTKDGTPIYDIRMPYMVVTGSSSVIATANISHATDQIRLAASTRPDAVLLDPGHDILMERKDKKWQQSEREAILKSAPCWLDRRDAAISLLEGLPGDDVVKLVTEQLGSHPIFDQPVLARLGQLKQPALKQVFLAEAFGKQAAQPKWRDPEVVAAAITALGQLPQDKDLAAIAIRYLDRNEVPYSVARAMLETLAGWDANLYLPEFKKAVQRESRQDNLRVAALHAIAKSTAEEALDLLVRYAQSGNSRTARRTAITLLEARTQDRTKVAAALAALLKDEDVQILREALSALGRIKDKSAIAAIRDLEKQTKNSEIRAAAKNTADIIEKS